jgi:mercuric reductase
MIEKGLLGGTCINWGCVPSKTLIHTALFAREAVLAGVRGVRFPSPEIDHAVLAGVRRKVVEELRRKKYLDILEALPGLTLLEGTARFVDRGSIDVDGRRIVSERILIATGGFPRVPRFPGLEEVDYLTSKTALLLEKFPPSLVIIGGGVVAVELGQMFHRLGTKVTILEHGPRILQGVEPEVAEELHRALVKEGVEIAVNINVCRLRKEGDVSVVDAQREGATVEFRGSRILVAVGTAPATAGIGLESAGVETDARGFVKVDNRMRTSAPGIWAAGDVTGGMMIATAGAREGVVAVDDMVDPECGCRIDYRTIPMAIFTDPEVASIGYGIRAAADAGIETVANTIPVTEVAKAHITGHTSGVVTIVAEKGTMRIIGVHLCAHRGADIINEAALAVRAGMTVDELAAVPHVYPSMGEALRVCAQGFTRDVTMLSCCAE